MSSSLHLVLDQICWCSCSRLPVRVPASVQPPAPFVVRMLSYLFCGCSRVVPSFGCGLLAISPIEYEVCRQWLDASLGMDLVCSHRGGLMSCAGTLTWMCEQWFGMLIWRSLIGMSVTCFCRLWWLSFECGWCHALAIDSRALWRRGLRLGGTDCGLQTEHGQFLELLLRALSIPESVYIVKEYFLIGFQSMQHLDILFPMSFAMSIASGERTSYLVIAEPPIPSRTSFVGRLVESKCSAIRQLAILKICLYGFQDSLQLFELEIWIRSQLHFSLWARCWTIYCLEQ